MESHPHIVAKFHGYLESFDVAIAIGEVDFGVDTMQALVVTRESDDIVWTNEAK